MTVRQTTERPLRRYGPPAAGVVLLIGVLAVLFVQYMQSAAGRYEPPTTPGDPPPIKVGAKAPDFTLADAQGNPVSLAKYRGQPVILVFFRSFGCGHCMTQLSELQGKLAEVRDAGGDIIGASADDQQNLRPGVTGAAAHGLAFVTLSDPRRVAIHAYGLLNPHDVLVPMEGGVAYPTTLILDKNGVVRWRYIGRDLADGPETAVVLRQFHAIAGQ